MAQSPLNILLTGGSSFTGYWFVRELSAAGHRVTAVMRRESVEAYEAGVRRDRVAGVAERAKTVFSCSFGDEGFLKLVREGGPWDVLCHHAADVTNYKSADFDVAGAVAANTKGIRGVLEGFKGSGGRRVVLTGSVFEGGEGSERWAGAAEQGLPHFSPYGLSKALTGEAVRFYARQAALRLGKFVIPNPFGPLEEPRFTAYLIKTWGQGKAAAVNTPEYVRDNIHVSLLAKAYRKFVETLPGEPGFSRCNPSGYVETQGAFAQRFAREMSGRLGMACELELRKQTDFGEPLVRFNTDKLDAAALGWDEARAWDEAAAFYRPPGK
ncbi:MAG: NAD(P)-dependent oxidoreductase [Phycisphaeraceae bacterium]|nr:NAD(P)-dependent oxidoreductase [Phycisphaeraceae bacterium]